MTINWRKVWRDHDRWAFSRGYTTVAAGRRNIEQLVAAQLAAKPKRKRKAKAPPR